MRGLFVLLLLGLLAPAAWAEKGLPGDNTEYYLVGSRPKSIPINEMFPLLPQALKDFVIDYERVSRRHDAKALERVTHPASRACENDSNHDYFDNLRQFYLTEDLPYDYSLVVLQVKPEMQQKLKRRLQLPVPPTHVMYMEFGSEGWQRFLRREVEDGKESYYEVMKCPTPEMLQELREQKREDAAEKDKGAAK